MTLSVNSVKGQGGFTGTAQARHNHQFVPGDLHIHIFQVIRPRAFDDNFILHEFLLPCLIVSKVYASATTSAAAARGRVHNT